MRLAALVLVAACGSAAVPVARGNAPAIGVPPPPPLISVALAAVLDTPAAVIGPPALRTTVKRRAGFFAYSVNGDPGVGGHATSTNLPRSLADADAPTVSGIELQAMPQDARSYQLGGTIYSGYRVVLANASQAPLEIAASDSRLPIVQEALDVDGNWRPIEYLPSSFCGNSWHTLILQPGEYWDFTAPRYGGGVATELRFTMTLDDGTELHSQPVGGSIDPRQFTDKEGHRPTNIMDPYWE